MKASSLTLHMPSSSSVIALGLHSKPSDNLNSFIFRRLAVFMDLGSVKSIKTITYFFCMTSKSTSKVKLDVTTTL